MIQQETCINQSHAHYGKKKRRIVVIRKGFQEGTFVHMPKVNYKLTRKLKALKAPPSKVTEKSLGSMI